MPVHLLDTNVLLALSWPNHEHHAKAHVWFAKHAGEGWATCPITQCGFVRISSNPKIISIAVPIRDALVTLRQAMDHPSHRFWPDDISILSEQFVQHGRLTGHSQVTDAYLLGLALRNGGRLATLDQRLEELVRQWKVDALTIIEAK